MSRLFIDINDQQWPIVYDNRYNVSFFGLQRFHEFDAKKWRNVFKRLKEAGLLNDERIVKPHHAKKEDLLEIHTPKYLKSLQWSIKVAVIAEMPILACVPNFIIQRSYLKPMRLQTGGTVAAGKLAVARGWAINIGGGFHHCSSDRGQGFCPYADISLLIRLLLKERYVSTAMVLDLDAHQGNGYERDFIGVPEVYIMDMYNKNIFPKDKKAKHAIRKKVELDYLVEDEEYMRKLKLYFAEALDEFTPDILIYNAGTDILRSDPLGALSVSGEGIIQRDEYVFKTCKDNKIPIVMLTSGGYLKISAKVIADSLLNLHEKGLIYGLN